MSCKDLRTVLNVIVCMYLTAFAVCMQRDWGAGHCQTLSHLAGCISAASVLARLCLQLDLDLA